MFRSCGTDNDWCSGSLRASAPPRTSEAWNCSTSGPSVCGRQSYYNSVWWRSVPLQATNNSPSLAKAVTQSAGGSRKSLPLRGQSSYGSGLKKQTLNTAWTYRAESIGIHRSLIDWNSTQSTVNWDDCDAIWNSHNLRKKLGTLAKSLNQRSASLFHLIVNGRSRLASVVRIQNSDQRRLPPDYTLEDIWIDKPPDISEDNRARPHLHDERVAHIP